MTPPIRFEHVSYRYPLRDAPALHDLSLDIEAGELLLLVGESGAGKSTFLRAINGLVPHFYGGAWAGRVLINGLDTRTVGPRDLSAHVGFVFQDPEAQFVVEIVEDELLFAMENFALPPPLMGERLEEVLTQLGIAHLRHRRIATLSGGEKQRVAIASVLTLHPSILVLDEPTSQLDPDAAAEVLDAVEALHRTRGLTVILAEHRLERVLHLAQRILFLPGKGQPPRIGPTREMIRHLPLVPPIVQLGRRLRWEPLPLTVDEARPLAPQVPPPSPPGASEPSYASGVAIEVERVHFAYGSAPALHDVSLTIHAGEAVAIMGPNGSGKSTLLKQMIGLLRPDTGAVRVAGRSLAGREVQEIARGVGYVPQNPNALLFAETVYEEPLVTLRNHGLDAASAPIAPTTLLARLGLDQVAHHYPRDLSTGQRERVALAAVLVTRPALLLLDEPTRGLDYGQKHALLSQLKAWQAEGTAVVIVTHDVELVAHFAERIILMEGGRVKADGPTRQVLAHAPSFAPQMVQLFGHTAWLTPDELPAPQMTAL